MYVLPRATLSLHQKPSNDTSKNLKIYFPIKSYNYKQQNFYSVKDETNETTTSFNLASVAAESCPSVVIVFNMSW